VGPQGGAGLGGRGRGSPESLVDGEGGAEAATEGVLRQWRSPAAGEGGGEVLQLEEGTREVRVKLTVGGGGRGQWQRCWLGHRHGREAEGKGKERGCARVAYEEENRGGEGKGRGRWRCPF
jgi:hypothetical protein